MSLKNTKSSFGLVSKLLHWFMAVILTSLFGIGLYMTNLDYYDSLYHTLPWWHKSFGLLVLFLLTLRFAWKLVNISPNALTSHKQWEVTLAHLIQKIFYLLILLIGFSGYFVSTAKGKGIEFFNWFEVPAINGQIEDSSAELIGSAHEVMAFLLAALVILHALAAFKHHFIDKDETLQRMINK